MNVNDEILKFRIGISGTYWDKKPEFRICINQDEFVHATISAGTDEIEYHEFTVHVGQGEHNHLTISLLNKTNSDVQKDNYDDPDNFKIIGDMLLNIHSIEIDEIDLGNLMRTASEYLLDESQQYNGETVNSIKECVNLGWNGTYRFAFGSPFYVWLLENM